MKLMVLSHFQCLMECSLSVFMIKKQIKFSLLETFWRKPLYYCKTVIVLSGLQNWNRLKIYHQNLLLIKQLLIYFKINLYPHPYSIYKDIHKLEANHYLEFDCNDFNFQIHEINQNLKHILKFRNQKPQE
jgi:asparagine synthase (glutamine-hydrolysing)